MDDKEKNKIVARQIAEMASAGMVVPVDPDDADMMGAFVEDALSAEDALDSRFDDVVGENNTRRNGAEGNDEGGDE